MESEIIDRLYRIYKENKYTVAQTMLKSEYISYPDGVDALIEHLNEYINSNFSRLPSYFSSMEAAAAQNELVRNIVETMQNVASMVDFARVDLLEKDSSHCDFYHEDESFEKVDSLSDVAEDGSLETDSDYDDFYDKDVPFGFEDEQYYRDSFDDYSSIERNPFDVDDSVEVFRDTIPQELFGMRMDFIREAYEKYNENSPGVSREGFEHLLSFMEYVKSQNLIQRVFMNNDILQMDLETVIASILDADKTILRNFYVEPLEFTARDVVGSDAELFDYFNFIKFGCEEIEDLDFKQYRSAFISRRGINVDLDKLVFVRNYLEFIRTGIIPTPDGQYYFEADFREKSESKKEFDKIYKRGFDNAAFIDHQANYIFDINGAMLSPGKLEKFKSVENDKSLTIGCLLVSNSLFCDYVHDDVYFLVHININDVTNSKSTYELQLNILPQGSIENRVQLVRFDNWAEEQTHKNLGNKLNTVTHIHLYNHLDLLRGKKNGAYDIAFNLQEESTDFETALKVFMEFVVRDENLRDKLLKRVLKAKEMAVSSFGSSGME